MIIDERKKCLKIDRFFDEYEPEIIFGIEDIEKGILDINNLLGNYEGIRVRWMA